jgi:hypothetical protein
VPVHIAPELFDEDKAGCWVRLQPTGPVQHEQMLRVMATQDLGCIRYQGHDPGVLAALALTDQAEAFRQLNDGRPVYELDGTAIFTLDGFFDEVSRVLVPGVAWGRNLDAFDDVLQGGFGTPPDGFGIRWSCHQLSRERLGYAATAGEHLRSLRRAHPSNWPGIFSCLVAAWMHRGPTLFDRLVEIISAHGQGGREAADNVRLLLD